MGDLVGDGRDSLPPGALLRRSEQITIINHRTNPINVTWPWNDEFITTIDNLFYSLSQLLVVIDLLSQKSPAQILMMEFLWMSCQSTDLGVLSLETKASSHVGDVKW